MLIAILVFVVVQLIVLISVGTFINAMNHDRRNQINQLIGNVDVLTRLVNNQPVGNIIHLGLKDGSVTTDVMPVSLSIRPEDYKVKVERLYDMLLDGVKTKSHPDIGVLAYCILKHAGIEALLDSKSWRESQDALTRLLINGDENAIKRFLKTLAESIGRVTPTEIATTKSITEARARARKRS